VFKSRRGRQKSRFNRSGFLAPVYDSQFPHPFHSKRYDHKKIEDVHTSLHPKKAVFPLKQLASPTPMAKPIQELKGKRNSSGASVAVEKPKLTSHPISEVQ
jgi:hypothetical protein